MLKFITLTIMTTITITIMTSITITIVFILSKPIFNSLNQRADTKTLRTTSTKSKDGKIQSALCNPF